MSDEKVRQIAFWSFWGGAATAALGFWLENSVVAPTGVVVGLGGLIAAFVYARRNPYDTSPITGY